MVTVSETMPLTVFRAVQCFLSRFDIENVPAYVSCVYMPRSFIKHYSGCFQERLFSDEINIQIGRR